MLAKFSKRLAVRSNRKIALLFSTCRAGRLTSILCFGMGTPAHSPHDDLKYVNNGDPGRQISLLCHIPDIDDHLVIERGSQRVPPSCASSERSGPGDQRVINQQESWSLMTKQLVGELLR